MKSMLLLCALIVGSSSVWAAKVTFTAGTDTGSSSVTKSGITITMSTMNESVYKCYKSSSMTVSSTVGKITEVKITCSANGTDKYGPGCFIIPTTGGVGSYTYESDGPTGTWTGNHDELSLYASTNQVRMSTIEVTYTSSGPSISAENVNITSGATGGSISYTINNAVTGGVLTAEKTSDSDWLTVGAVSASAVAFTTEANTGAARSATVRLTYTYDTDKTVTKDVTVTQAVYVAPVEFTELYESFDTQSSVGGNTGGFATSSNTNMSSYSNWTISNKVYPADRCVRVGASSGSSYIETPALKLNSEVTYVLTFKAAPWGTDGTTLTLSSSDAIFGGKTSKAVTMSANKWTSYYVELTAGLPTSKIRFTPAKRFFLDEVRVMEKSAFDALTASKTVESYGWATYIPDYAVEFESGDAYVVTAAAVSTGLTLEGVTKVPAKTPVLLKGAGGKTITVINDASVAAPATNLLIIGNGKTLASGEYPYVLAKNGESACFKQWTGTAATLNGRVVLVLDESVATSRSFFNLDDETTSIKQVETSKSNNDGFYNLAGQRVAQPSKGLYIVNGKKFIMK